MGWLASLNMSRVGLVTPTRRSGSSTRPESGSDVFDGEVLCLGQVVVGQDVQCVLPVLSGLVHVAEGEVGAGEFVVSGPGPWAG